MPTGYTADLYDGKPQTFPEFAMECARAFGALVELRDEPNAPIPDSFQPSDYYVRSLKTAEERMAQLLSMTPDEAQEAANEDYEQAARQFREALAEAYQRRSRYDAMLADVAAWVPPTEEHVELKRFMVEQIEESTRFDCSTSYLTEPQRQSAAEWLRGQIEAAQRDIDYAAKHLEEERQRADSRTAWVRALRSSLPSVPASA